MLRSLFVLLVIAVAIPTSAPSQGVPIIKTLDKMEALRGDTVVVSGERLGKADIADLLLTNGKDDVKVDVLEQSDAAIKFKVAGDTKYGRYGLLILTTGENPMYVEQPVKLSVVEKLSPKEEPPPPPPPAETEKPAPNR